MNVYALFLISIMQNMPSRLNQNRTIKPYSKLW